MGDSKLRPGLHDARDSYAPRGATAYYVIYNAVKEQPGLIHGRLHGAHGEHCAIGSYFALNRQNALDYTLIDEVAAVNDSCPKATPRQRKQIVLRWLQWKLQELGMPVTRKRIEKKP